MTKQRRHAPHAGGVDQLGVDAKWENCLVVVNCEGKIIETWKQWDHLFRGPHSIYISLYDPEKNVWVVDDNMQVIYKFTHDGSKLLQKLYGRPGGEAHHCAESSSISFPGSLLRGCQLEFLSGRFSSPRFPDHPGAQTSSRCRLGAGGRNRVHHRWRALSEIRAVAVVGRAAVVPGSSLLILGLAYGGGFLAAHLSRPWLRRLGTASVCHDFGWDVRTWPGFWS